MKKAIHELTAEEYLEEIRKVRSNPPDVTSEEAYQQYLNSMGSREPSAAPSKVAPSGNGLKKPRAA